MLFEATFVWREALQRRKSNLHVDTNRAHNGRSILSARLFDHIEQIHAHLLD